VPEKVTVKTAPPREAEPVRPSASGSPLEEAVRDMLQPLLVQWLNEHMPRILENAVREEIATRGLLPKTEK
jgi:cell pole-organizing protein PopZ